MAGVILESFSGVETESQLVGKWLSVSSSARLVDAGPCRAYANDSGTGNFRFAIYGFATDEIDNFLVIGFRGNVSSVSGGNATYGSRFVFAGDSTAADETADIVVTVRNTGAVQVMRVDFGSYVTLASTATGIIADDTEFTVGVEVLKSNTAGTVKIWVNDVLRVSATGLDTKSDVATTDNFSAIKVGVDGTGADPATSADWITSLFVFNGLGTDYRFYQGHRDVGIKFPSQDGPSEEFDPGAGGGGNYTLVDERNVTDGTDYISADAANLEDLYLFPAAEGSGEAGPVQITARDQKTAGTVEYSIRGQIGSSNTGSAAIIAESSWGNGRYVFQRAPNGGTWDIGDVDASAFGVRSTTVSGGVLRVEQLYLEYLVETYTPTTCGGPGASDTISEYSDSDLTVPGNIGPPEVQEHQVEETDQFNWAEEDPGGFMEGRLSRPLKILSASPINYFDDVYYRFNGVEWYRGRVERIDRRSDASGEWVDYTLAGWIQNSQADRLYWGRIQDRRLDAWNGQAGVGPGGYVDQYQVSEVLTIFQNGEPIPSIQVSLPAGTNLGQPAGGVVQFDWHTDPNAPDPEIERIRFTWSVNQVIPGCRFQIVAYHPIGSYAPPTIIYNELHSGGGHAVSLFRDDVSVSPPNQAVIPEGTWRLLIRPYAFTQAVGTVPEPGLIVNLWSFAIGQLPTAEPMRPAAVVQEVVSTSCPALDTSEIPTTDDPAVEGLVYETPTPQTQIFEEMLRYEPPGWTYWVREKKANGRYRFFFGARSDAIKYEVSNVEIQSLGGDAEVLCNRVTVSFEDYLGRPATYVAEQTVSLLDDVSESILTPFTRERHIHVGKLRGITYQENLENAAVIAETFLAESAEPAEVGQFRVIGKQVKDLDTSQQIDFREIKSGHLIRVTDTGTGTAAIWRIRRVEKTLGMGMEAQVIVGKGSSNLDSVIARLREPTLG